MCAVSNIIIIVVVAIIITLQHSNSKTYATFTEQRPTFTDLPLRIMFENCLSFFFFFNRYIGA